MLLHHLFENELLPANVIGYQIGKYFGELAKFIKAENLKKDPTIGCSATLDLDGDPILEVMITFDQRSTRPVNFQAAANKLFKQTGLSKVTQIAKLTREDEYSWMYTIRCFYFPELSEEDEDKAAQNIKKGFTQHIGDVDVNAINF